jgi:hypothetical protein
MWNAHGEGGLRVTQLFMAKFSCEVGIIKQMNWHVTWFINSHVAWCSSL